MTPTRTTTWSDNQVLTASALNGEFNNLLNAPAIADADISGSAAITLSKITGTAVNLSSVQTLSGAKTFSALATFTGNVIVSAVYDNGSQTGTYAIDWTKGDRQKVTATGNITFTYSGAVTGQVLTLWIYNGTNTITLPTSKYPNGVAPTFTTGAGAINSIIVYYDGSSYLTQSAVGFA